MPRRINIGVVQQHQKDCQSPKGVELRNLLHVHAGKRSAPVERTPNLKSSRQTLLRDHDHSLLLWTTVLFPTRGSYTSAAVILSLTVLWLVFGVVITRRLGKPTCRVCIFRQFCRNRESQHSNPTNKPLELRPDRSMHNAKARSAIINLPSAASARRVVALNYTLN